MNDPPVNVVALTEPMVAVVPKRLVVEAFVEKKLVEVLLVITPRPAKKLEVVALEDEAFVVKKLVEVALENTDEEARNVPGRVSVLTDER